MESKESVLQLDGLTTVKIDNEGWMIIYQWDDQEVSLHPDEIEKLFEFWKESVKDCE